MVYSLIKSVDFVQDVVASYLQMNGVGPSDEMQKDMHDGANIYNYESKQSGFQNYFEDQKFRQNPSSEEAVKPKVSRLQSADHEFN